MTKPRHCEQSERECLITVIMWLMYTTADGGDLEQSYARLCRYSNRDLRTILAIFSWEPEL